jgi:hypothetical protein
VINGTFRIGEPVSVGIIVPAEAAALVTAATAFIARSENEARFQPAPGFVPLQLAAAARAAAGAVGPGWNFTLSAAQSATLEPGIYGIDSRLSFATGDPEFSEETLLIELTASAVPTP